MDELEERVTGASVKSEADSNVNSEVVVEEEDEEGEGEEQKEGGKSMEVENGKMNGQIGEEEEDSELGQMLDLGPQFSLKQQLEKDKEDESLRRWKEQLLGNLDLDSVGEHLEPEVRIENLSIVSPGRPDLLFSLSLAPNAKVPWFTLKEGSTYKLKFSFSVRNNIVLGLRYSNTVWKAGLRVDSMKEMLGTFSPRAEPYEYEMQEERTPSGIFARGSYSARSRFIDDDGKCHLEINYTFDIRKEWGSTKVS